MTIKHIFFAALTVALAASCSSDDSANGADNGQSEGKVKVTLTASAPETRVGMTKENNKATLYWHSDDKILVQTVKDGTYGGAELTAANGTETGSTSATFTGEVATDTKLGTYAVYPYNENHKFTGEKALTYNLPATYTYSTVESRVFSKTVDGTTTYPSNSTNLPMLGTISDNKVTFKMLGGMAVIRIDSMPAASGTIKVTADQQLSGNFSIADLSATDSIATSTSSTGNSVTFTFAGATAGSAGVFYLPLATGSYTNVSIAVTCDGTTQTANYGDLSINRCDVKAISLTTNSEGKLMYIEKLGDNKYKINGHTFVDLGLSVVWAETNVGATTSSAAGYFFAWGETQTKTDYSESNYNVSSFADAATANWGASCRMPTNTECNELLSSSNCTWASGSGGYTVTSTSKKSSIFLPYTGYYNGSTLTDSDVGHFWTSTETGTDNKVNRLYIKSGTTKMLEASKYHGFTVRPVVKLPSSMK